MSDILSRMEQDTADSAIESIDQEAIATVAQMARAIRQKEELLSSLEQQVKDEKKALLKMTDEELPAIMIENRIKGLNLDDGSYLSIKQTYGATITVDNRPKAYEWLRENGHDDIIKNQVSCTFGRGEDDQASAFHAFAAKAGYSAEQKTEIHSQTLRAFIKDRVEAGDDFPMELFGAWIGQRAVIKRKK